MWFFAWSTGVSIPVWVEGRYVNRGEADFVLAEPTAVQLLKTFRYFVSVGESKLATALVPERKFKTTASSIKLGWSQRLAGMAGRPCEPTFFGAFNDLKRQLMTKTSVKRPNLSFRPHL